MDIKQLSAANLQNQLKSEQRGVKLEDSSINKNNQQVSNGDNNSNTTKVTDRVDISAQAQKVQRAVDSLKSVADVNVQKVTSLKTAISSGNYQVNSSTTADKLLNIELGFRQ